MSLLKTFRSRGKLLITGEYTVLDGALALAVPTQLGQALDIYKSSDKNKGVLWQAYKHDGNLWENCTLDITGEKIIKTSNSQFAETLLNIFIQAVKLGSPLFKDEVGFECETQLEFPEDWGLGSSSTLINNIAKWTQVDPYLLLKKTFGGSGYDLACAEAESPITYQLNKEEVLVKEVFLSPEITDNLFFVHLNKKQNSREGIQHYRRKEKSGQLINSISEITQEIIKPKCSFQQFSTLMTEHEKLISDFIEIKTVKERLFLDYEGFIKSLGAWGGDFIMIEKTESTEDYFKNKGYKTLKHYDEILI